MSVYVCVLVYGMESVTQEMSSEIIFTFVYFTIELSFISDTIVTFLFSNYLISFLCFFYPVFFVRRTLTIVVWHRIRMVNQLTLTRLDE